MKIVFFGTPEFAKRILEALLKSEHEVAAVVTNPDKAVGRSKELRPSPVKLLAEEHSIPIYQPHKASNPEFASFLETLGAELFIVAAYGEIFKENLLEMPPKGCINVHASLLPLYRGAAPIQRAIMAGEKETGITIMKMAAQLDAGDMLNVAKISIDDDMVAGELFEKLASLGGHALVETLNNLDSIEPIVQDNRETTYAKKLTKEDGKLDWEKSAKDVYNQFRGVSPKPGAWCEVEVSGKAKKMLIKKARRCADCGHRSGEILSDSELIIACGGGGSLKLLEVQLEGKRALTAHDFLKGTPRSILKF
ncbi:MAG: methionyl-tRNA formyltransferase [Chlamydiales bacterium]|nr:methionyl-tRNA formyltransferase [Chlamydiales bacterium]